MKSRTAACALAVLRLLHKPNPYHFSSGVLDFTVVTHSPRKRDRVFALQLTDDLSGSENRTNNGNLTVPALIRLRTSAF